MERMATAKTMVNRITGRVLPSAPALMMLVGTMVMRKLVMVGVVISPSYTGAFSKTVPRPGRMTQAIAREITAQTMNISTYSTTVRTPMRRRRLPSLMLAMPQKTAQTTMGMIISLMRLR